MCFGMIFKHDKSDFKITFKHVDESLFLVHISLFILIGK